MFFLLYSQFFKLNSQKVIDEEGSRLFIQKQRQRPVDESMQIIFQCRLFSTLKLSKQIIF